MRDTLADRDALGAISPSALAAYANVAGWEFSETFGDHSNVYTHIEEPEIVVPRTQRIADYTTVVSQLIDIFAAAAKVSPLSLYRDISIADRDVIRVRASESLDGHISTNAGVSLVQGSRDMILAAACSVLNPRAVYRAGANRDASAFVDRTRLGQTEEGSFVVTLLGPEVPPILEPSLGPDWAAPSGDPIERRITKRIAQAVTAAHEATERASGGDRAAFENAVANGVSANLCEALIMIIDPFAELDVSVTWALTRPLDRQVTRFAQSDIPVLREASRAFRQREPRFDERIFGFVQRLKRDHDELDGTITLRASIDDNVRSVIAVLSQSDYQTAIKAHEERAMVIATGDLEQTGQRWRLLNPHIVDIVASPNEDDPQQR